MHYFYRSEHPDTVAIVQDYHRQLGALRLATERLGEAMGGEVCLLRSYTDVYPGGVKLSASNALDVHWCRPDQLGYRSLRVKPKTAKGLTKEQRDTISAEHQRLVQQWHTLCPPRLDVHGFWDRLGVNTGNLLLGGGLFFVHQDTAFFCLGFGIDAAAHEYARAAGKPSAGWIEGAVEILPSDWESARNAHLREVENATAGAH
ncbi:hypothetical protein NS201_05225 [Pseudomonas oryzihabitans]|nr:hypothetical protein NS201_05225 [Pseudomonas psychrotolerans]